MARPRPAAAVKLVISLLSGDEDLLRRAQQLLSRRYGAVEAESAALPFTQSDYYELEMGANLLRRVISFHAPIAPDRLDEIKLETNALEREIADQCADPLIVRPVNVDPGYVDSSKFVLATMKDRGHRIYLSRGVYAEVTLLFADGRWQAQPWTYPSYREPGVQTFLAQARERLTAQRREGAAE